MKLEYVVTENDDNRLLKDVAKKRLNLSTRLFNKIKLNHHIFINNKVAFANDIIHTDDIISIDFDYEEEDNTIPQKHDLEILYEDDWYIAVNKPANIVVHPCSYHPDNTLANYLKYYLNSKKKIRPVNRLDNGTSGIVLFAKNEYAQERFKNIKDDKVIKKYLAIVYGFLDKKEGTINAPIARKEGSIIERCIDEKGQEAITKYNVIKEFIKNDVKLSLVQIELKTGRTHQIRVHFKHIGHPLVGDKLYNKEHTEFEKIIERQSLHAERLSFVHPITSKNVEISAKLPNEINIILE